MRSQPRSFRFVIPLDKEMENICKSEGFRNLNACWTAAGIRFVQDHRRLKWVRLIANAPPKQQDFILDKLLNFPTEMNEIIEQLKRLDKR